MEFYKRKMNPTDRRLESKRLMKELVPPEHVIKHYTKVTQLEVRLKNIAIHQIEKKRHEKAK